MTEPADPHADRPGAPGPAAGGHDAREGSGDPRTDPAAVGERSFAEPDADGGAVPEQPPA